MVERDNCNQKRSMALRLLRTRGSSVACIFYCVLVFAVTPVFGDYRHDDEDAYKPFIKLESQADLFEPSDLVRVVPPSHFPKPTDPLGPDVAIIVEPTFGEHRPDQDAILAYAEGYRLSYYMMFMETLTDTGFRGDVVLAIAEPRIIRPDVEDYLRTFAQGDPDKPSIIVYQQALKCTARDGNLKNERTVSKSGDTDVFQMCQLSHVYGWKDEMGHVTRTAEDPREGRVVATIRYEWYWIWSQQYNPHSWLMLIDARDSFFQLNPFAGLPRDGDKNSPDGLLYLFGENADATRLGKSKKNLKWIQNGYGDSTLKALSDKPTICSGSTMGEQIAIETYLRAMVNEHDECDVHMTGSDQGFHNYLYYSSKLTAAETIRKIVVWEQGRGAINNLGALRTKAFKEWGMYDPDKHIVYQWDGTKSPVAHQWDRDKELHAWMNGKKHREWNKEWEKRKEEGSKKQEA